MGPGEVAGIAAAIVAFSLVSQRIGRWPLTMPLVFVSLGMIASWSGFVELDTDDEAIALLAEVTLAVILFSDAVRIELRRLRRQLATPVRLLAVGLPLSIVVGTALNSLLFPDLPVAQVALLAPTDAALGSAVVEDDAVPSRDRLALNVESGVNDGLVVPVVAILVAVVLDEGRSTGSWIVFVLRQVGGGVALGVLVGAGVVVLLSRAHRFGWSDGRYEQLATLMVPVLCLFVAEWSDVNAFVAAFVAGLAFGAVGHREDADGTADHRSATVFSEYTEDTAQLLAIMAFFVFGNVLLVRVDDDISAPVIVCSLLALSVGRIAPVWIALARTGLSWQTRLFLGWFGPRGLASIVFGLLLLEEFDGDGSAIAEQLFGVIGLTVAASIVLHGASAAWGARTYGEWARTAGPQPEAVDGDTDGMPRTRWSAR